LFSGSRSPDPLSLPLATFVFTVITASVLYLIVEYGSIQIPFACEQEPYFPLGPCGFSQYEIAYVACATLVVLIFCGMALPADSNLIRANNRISAFAQSAYTNARSALASYRKQRRDRLKREKDERARMEEAEKEMTGDDAAPDPFPTTNDNASVTVMCLKLRRSQRYALMGKMIFVLDARIELTAEERSLLQKYHLGDAVVYESTSRERHREAMKAHAESTRDQPRLRDSLNAQLLGAGKTLYRLARAGASATAVALSLRVTVHSLMQGVHIECKSMDELLGAENAIVEAARNLKAYLQTAATFDGREEIIEL
jgi:hypothetical protein